MLKIGLATLGCKVNQCDSAALSENLASAGFSLVPFNAFADVYILNTCTVTAFADFQARQLIRRALRQNPAARIVVTGCYAQTQPLLLAGMEGVAHVVGNDRKLQIAELLHQPAPDSPRILVDDMARHTRFPFAHACALTGRTRAFFKIQDGCSAFCSYCIVPFARGPCRSLPFGEVLKGARNFIERGFREIVLTGIHLGDYGHDLQPRTSLVRSLEALLSNHPETRFRLSSIEPNEIADELLELFKRFPNLCPHLHIPLQSGDDSILKRMKRGYDAAFYYALVENVVRTAADIAVGIDVLVGFPGEGEKEFSRTMELLEKIPAAYLHVFPYSERPGTAAAKLFPKVPATVKKERAAAVRALGVKKREAFSRRFVGSVLPVLVEKTRDKHTGLAKGFSHNYLPVLLDKSTASLVNHLVNVRIDRIRDGKLIGRVLDE